MNGMNNPERLVESYQDEVIKDVWFPTGNEPVERQPRFGRLLQSEATRHLAGSIQSIIDSAKQIVLVSSFLLSDSGVVGAIQRASRRGVRTYLLVASEQRIGKAIKEERDRDLDLLEQHKKLLNDLVGWTLVRTAEHFHAKFVVSDPWESGRGFLLTSNLTTEALDRNVELALELTASEVQAIGRLFAWAFWEDIQHELLEPGRLRAANATGRTKLPEVVGNVRATAGSRRDLRDETLALIESAHRELVVSTFGLSHKKIIEALSEQAQTGTKVTLLVRPSRPANFPAIHELAKAGVTVLGVPWIHAKAICVDGVRGLVMTGNLEEHGLESGFEVGVTLNGDDATSLRSLLQSWIVGAPREFQQQVKLGSLLGDIESWDGSKYIKTKVQAQQSKDFGIVIPRCCSEFATIKPAIPPISPGERYHERVWSWKKDLPRLATDATILSPAELGLSGTARPPSNGSKTFPVFRERSGRLVLAISSIEELDQARSEMKRVGAQAIVIKHRRHEGSS